MVNSQKKRSRDGWMDRFRALIVVQMEMEVVGRWLLVVVVVVGGGVDGDGVKTQAARQLQAGQ